MIKLNYQEREYFKKSLEAFIKENIERFHISRNEVIELIDDYICY